MKSIILITILCATAMHAQDYTSNWSEFDSGRAAHNGGTITHAGVLCGWLRTPMSSAGYTNQQGHPSLPMPVPTQGAPVLTITLVGGNARVAWPASAAQFTLQQSPALGSGDSWTDVPGPYQENGGERFILVPPAQAARFYRLMAP